MDSRCDNSLFIHTSTTYKLFVLVYVDGIIVTRSSSIHVHKVIDALSSAFALKKLGKLDYFLGIEVKHLANGSVLKSQSKYIKDPLDRAHMGLAKSVTAPMISNCKLSKVGDDVVSDPTFYRSIVGALQYATVTRPGI
ncbi:putative RNA-directed DNA polymerase [Lupinus albus]|uniref:Putative RNA-directed DNA polymerase n=1 Tax=Lupinus albus TaxID=3870 RepID=A0A6A4QC45_LUPAL|nr:putative RNA-directed DNA polymerase [Lupinus albus]